MGWSPHQTKQRLPTNTRRSPTPNQGSRRRNGAKDDLTPEKRAVGGSKNKAHHNNSLQNKTCEPTQRQNEPLEHKTFKQTNMPHNAPRRRQLRALRTLGCADCAMQQASMRPNQNRGRWVGERKQRRRWPNGVRPAQAKQPSHVKNNQTTKHQRRKACD